MSVPPPELPAVKPPGRRQSRFKFVGVLGFLIATLLFWAAWLMQPASSEYRRVSVTIPRGTNALAIGRLLQRESVIRSPYAFLYVARTRSKSSLKAGEYALSPNMTLARIVQTLEAGPTRSRDDVARVTIPEGYTLSQIANLLDSRDVADLVSFRLSASRPDVAARAVPELLIPAGSLEGYLFPDTYEFRYGTPPERVLETLLVNFQSKFARPYQQEIARSGENLHALVTKASLIEREARVPQDRARIAGVIENRLKRGMRLQIDASVLYALGEHRERVTYRDLEVESPYNTYRHAGLPPNPIANPGLASLEAALRPEHNDFLYYVARPDGTHIFTRTLKEHEAAKAKVRRERDTARRGTEGAR